MYSVKRCKPQSTQVGTSFPIDFKDQFTQTKINSLGSYNRSERSAKRMFTTYDHLKDNILADRDGFIEWLRKEQLIATNMSCPKCQQPMNWVECTDRTDGYKWECRRKINRKTHREEVSIRKNSWFEKSNLTLEEVVKFTYWWSVGMEQCQITDQLSLASNTGVDWDSFCREVCEVTFNAR